MGVKLQQGVDQETDAQLRLRRQASVALPAIKLRDETLGKVAGSIPNIETALPFTVMETDTISSPPNFICRHQKPYRTRGLLLSL